MFRKKSGSEGGLKRRGTHRSKGGMVSQDATAHRAPYSPSIQPAAWVNRRMKMKIGNRRLEIARYGIVGAASKGHRVRAGHAAIDRPAGKDGARDRLAEPARLGFPVLTRTPSRRSCSRASHVSGDVVVRLIRIASRVVHELLP
jgi:hypothetical protein